MGSVGQTELSTSIASLPSKKPVRSILVKNLPVNVAQEELRDLVKQFGTVVKCQQVSVKEGDKMENYMNVVYETTDMAQHAMEQLDNYDMYGQRLHVEYQNNGRQNAGNRVRAAPRNPYQPTEGRYNTGYPLRILVPSEVVGAIIGKKGQTIRTITTQCKARVDVHGKENSGLLEKVISIFGQPENVSKACKEILKVMQQEATTNNQGQIVLRMLADDRFCGRIIGREGKLIKKIRDDSDTKITVSSMQDMAHMYPDRVITIRGGVDNLVQAEACISQKLAECMEKDAQAANMGGGMMMSHMIGGSPSSMPVIGQSASTSAAVYPPPNIRRNMYSHQGPAHMYPQVYMGGSAASGMGGPSNGSGPMGAGYVSGGGEMCQISVPNSTVGAIIGAGGSIIKQIMHDSNAHVTVESKKDDNNPSSERTVVIRGSTDACWKASYFIFEKMRSDGMNPTGEAVRLKTAIKIPKAMVGRVIGKAGKNVREIQRMTGATIKLPEDPSSQGDEVLVEVYGTFMATQGAHNRIRALVGQGLYGGAGGDAGPHLAMRTGGGIQNNVGGRRPPPIEVQ